jgi:hypothetical protein
VTGKLTPAAAGPADSTAPRRRACHCAPHPSRVVHKRLAADDHSIRKVINPAQHHTSGFQVWLHLMKFSCIRINIRNCSRSRSPQTRIANERGRCSGLHPSPFPEEEMAHHMDGVERNQSTTQERSWRLHHLTFSLRRRRLQTAWTERSGVKCSGKSRVSSRNPPKGPKLVRVSSTQPTSPQQGGKRKV